MSILIEKVELKNIRLHNYIVFEPELDGVTAITGANGSGKSTIIDGIAWALYGTKPSGVSKNSALLKDGVDLKTEESFVRVFLNVDNIHVKVERRIVNKAGSVECDIWTRNNEDEEWNHQSGPAVSHTDPVVRRTLKMDEKGFLAAVLVQQKQVDQLISAGPKERAYVIERLTGISSITAGLQEAKDQHRTLKKTVDSTDYDQTLLEKLMKEYEELTKEQEALLKKRDANTPKLEELKQQLADVGKKVSEMEIVETRTVELENKIAETTAVIKEKEEYQKKLNEKKNAQKKKLSGSGKQNDWAELERKLKDLQRQKSSKEKQLFNFEKQQTELVTTINSNTEVIDKSSVKTSDEAEKGYQRSKAKARNAEKRITEIVEQIGGFQSSITRFKKAITVIGSADATCPTCLQKVHDPKDATEGLQEEIRDAEKRVSELQKEKTTKEKTLETALEAAEKFELLFNCINSNAELEQSLNLVTLEKNTLESSMIVLEKELKAVEKLHNNAQYLRELQDDYDRLLEELVEVSDTVERLLGAKNDCVAEKKQLGGFSRRELDSARSLYRKLSEGISDLQGLISEDISALRVVETKLGYVSDNIDTQRNVAKNYEGLLESVEIAQKSVDLMEEFRRVRIENSVPVVSEYASELLSRFTDGKFVELTLDNKFNTTVVLSNGTERPVGLLSGGEYSIVALALRIAISLMLNAGASSSTLVLDEVLVSQDNDRSELILTTIKDVCQGQVIMVSHGSNTVEIADKVVELSSW